MNLAELLSSSKKPILLDGAMGTQLAEVGLEMGGQNSVLHPEAVRDVHQHYVDRDIDLLITNTLTMNRAYIEAHKLGIDVREVNLSGARLAKETVKNGQYVLGDVSSTGKLLKPYGDLVEEDAFAAFREQASILEEGGVDGFIIETMIDLQEALVVLRAIKDVSELPVIACIAFNTTNNGGRTIMGNSAKDCAQALTEAGAVAVGTNCGDLDPFEMAEIVATMRDATSRPIIAQPNAGTPRLENGETVFDMSAADFAKGMHECLKAGASLVGGCCGTSPDHIQALAEIIEH
ncbi:MAG: hypothetical protein FVQ83_09535 [Chloroflexi bacterium]|nr:hypothetical protein [Chloroflexota bacterium]